MKNNQIIGANPDFKKPFPSEPYLEVSEFFADTIQGEGITIGHPAAFLRLQHCTLACTWCDTTAIWHRGNPYTFEELFELMEDADLIRKLYRGQHLVLTGGSPLKQQNRLIDFIRAFIERFGFKPFIEVENECTLMPASDLIDLVDIWNNSPKLANSKNSNVSRYRPDILSYLSSLSNSWFKFVVEGDEMEEILDLYINPGYIKMEQVILMPMGANRMELEKNRENVLRMAIMYNVRYCTREQVILWDEKTGV